MTPPAPLTHASHRGQYKIGRDRFREALSSQCSLLVLRALRQVGMSVVEFGRALNVDASRVSIWTNAKAGQSPNLAHLLIAPDCVVDALLRLIAESRARNGHGRRRWVEDERDADHAQRAEQLTAAVDAVADEARAIAAKMRGTE